MASTRHYGGESLEQRRAQRRQRLIDAGIEVFSRDTYAAASVPAVCSEAGLSSRQFYEVFANREALLAAIYGEINTAAMARVAESVAGLPATADDVEVWIRLGIRAYFDYFRADPRLVRINFIEVVGVSPDLEERRRRTREDWSATLENVSRAASDRGLIPARDRSFDWMIFLGAVNAATVEYATRPEVDLQTVTETVLRLINTGIRG